MHSETIATIGLLPLYLELYDEAMPELRKDFAPFIDKVVRSFEEKGIRPLVADVCCTAPQFESAISLFEEHDVDCIVTLHLTYSPSLESIEALSRTSLPLIVLNTTPDPAFDSTDLLMHNHGIHGVQDMCNLLKRKGKKFFIEAGHLDLSNIVERAAAHVTGAKIAKAFSRSRVGKIGNTFAGMGDFQVEKTELDAIGIKVIDATPGDVARHLPTPNNPTVLKEIEDDRAAYDASRLSNEVLERSVRTGLALRKWINEEKIDALTINFQVITQDAGLPVMPFLEISKLMGRGIGYAGEGDVLDAAFVGALSKVLGEVSFTEMFCPDWKNDVIFLSHMGEINIALSEEKVQLFEKDWPFTNAGAPVYPSACFRQGEALLVNLAPGGNRKFSLIISPVRMLKELDKKKTKGIRGWMKPEIPVNDFLKKYSEAGGTHHVALVYGRPTTILKSFASIMNWEITEIK